MEVEVEISSKQIIDGKIAGSETNTCKGKIEYYKNGEMLEFTEKYEEQELKFKINILKDKIVINRNGQNMILDLKNKTKASLETPYGSMDMLVLAKHIEIKKEENFIKQIYLKYEIELEENTKYDNIVEINISF